MTGRPSGGVKLRKRPSGACANALVLARGKMGQRISDSSENLFGDGETLWACGYVDRQEVGYLYMGDPEGVGRILDG